MAVDEPWKYFVCRNTLWGVIANLYTRTECCARLVSCLYLTITPTMQRHRSLCLCFTQKTSIFHLKYKTKDIADVCLRLWQKSPIEFVFPLQLSTKIYCAKTYRDVILDFLSFYPFFFLSPFSICP